MESFENQDSKKTAIKYYFILLDFFRKIIKKFVKNYTRFDI